MNDAFGTIELALKKMKKDIDNVSIVEDSLVYRNDKGVKIKLTDNSYCNDKSSCLIIRMFAFDMMIISNYVENYIHEAIGGPIRTIKARIAYKAILKQLRKNKKEKDSKNFIIAANNALIDPIEDIVLAEKGGVDGV